MGLQQLILSQPYSSRSSEARCKWTEALSKSSSPGDKASVTRSMSLCCRRNTLYTSMCFFCFSDIWTCTESSGPRKGLTSKSPEYSHPTSSCPLAVGATRQASSWNTPPVSSVSRGLTPSQLGSTPLSRQSPERGCTSIYIPMLVMDTRLPSIE